MKNLNPVDQQKQLIQSFATMLAGQGLRTRIFETHISWVIVTDQFAYKFKKAVRFDFVDFSTIEARQFYCEEELRLNRRLAPGMYLDVIKITGDGERPILAAAGMPLEYAVKMHAFPQNALWSYRIPHRDIAAGEIDDLATKLAGFHTQSAVAPAHSTWSTSEALRITALETLDSIESMTRGDKENAYLHEIEKWRSAWQSRLESIFHSRKMQGAVRECHGDLHCGNILTLHGQVEVFDCIEFNEALRWIDVINDISFTYMDLRCQHRPDLATRFLNQYLEQTGDYQGLSVLRYYSMHRALIRCKVGLLRFQQLAASKPKNAISQYEQALQYLAFAALEGRDSLSAVVIMHGFSGSGKSTLAAKLSELTGAIRIRSDVERKRMSGMKSTERCSTTLGSGLYDASSTQLTYRRLHELARHIVESQMPVIVDATFLKREQRSLFERLALDSKVPFYILDVRASEPVMKERIALRAHRDDDASDAELHVLAHQLIHHEPLLERELPHAITIDNENGLDVETVTAIAHSVVTALERSTHSAVFH